MNIKWISKDTFTDPEKNIGKTEAQIYDEFLLQFKSKWQTTKTK